jgi:hypothetical protein
MQKLLKMKLLLFATAALLSVAVQANENVLELGDGTMDIAKTTPTFVKFYAPVDILDLDF